jgi:hypothetical protein
LVSEFTALCCGCKVYFKLVIKHRIQQAQGYVFRCGVQIVLGIYIRTNHLRKMTHTVEGHSLFHNEEATACVQGLSERIRKLIDETTTTTTTTFQFPYLETCRMKKWGEVKERRGAGYEASDMRCQ